MPDSRQIRQQLERAIDAGGSELTQCLLDLGLLRREGNRLVRTARGDHAIAVIDQELADRAHTR